MKANHPAPSELEALAFDELEVERAAPLQKHAVECAACTSELEEIRRARGIFSGPERRTPERIAHLYPGIAERVHALQASRGARRRSAALVMTFACLTVLVMLPALRSTPAAKRSAIDSAFSICSEPPVCEVSAPSEDPGIRALEDQYAACLIATPAQPAPLH